MEHYCQSCSMSMSSDNLLGTNMDGSHHTDYCTFCFQHGKFTQDYTMDEIIEHCIQFLDEFNKNSNQKITKEEAIAEMKAEFPKLKRWMNQ